MAAAGPLDAVLRSAGATMGERRGHRVALHFGSAMSEAAACGRTVGLADRSDRITLAVAGPLPAGGVPGGLGWAGPVPGGGDDWLVRCEAADAEACAAALVSAGFSPRDVSHSWAALALIGPRALRLLRAAGLLDEAPAVAEVVRLGDLDEHVELLVPAALGPALWNRLLEAGRPLSLAFVGLDAIEHLAASEHLGHPTH